jgi:hypothetical protein
MTFTYYAFLALIALWPICAGLLFLWARSDADSLEINLTQEFDEYRRRQQPDEEIL